MYVMNVWPEGTCIFLTLKWDPYMYSVTYLFTRGLRLSTTSKCVFLSTIQEKNEDEFPIFWKCLAFEHLVLWSARRSPSVCSPALLSLPSSSESLSRTRIASPTPLSVCPCARVASTPLTGIMDMTKWGANSWHCVMQMRVRGWFWLERTTDN